MTDLAAEVTERDAGTLSLGLALSPMPWRAALHRHCRDHEAEVAVRLLTDAARLADGEEPPPDVVLVDDTTSWLSPSLVRRLAGRGIAVLGLYDPVDGDGQGRRLLIRAGVAAVAEATASSETLVDLARGLRPDPTVAATFDALVTGAFAGSTATCGAVIAVGGPAGSGATETAVALAAALGDTWAADGDRAGGPERRPVLLDGDERRPRLARRLGLALHPNVLSACDLLERRLDEPGIGSGHLAPPTVPVDPGLAEGGPMVDLAAAFAAPALTRRPLDGAEVRRFDVLTGLAAREDWTQLRADEVSAVVDTLAEEGRSIVARVGSELGTITSAPGRWATSRRLLGRADLVVAVAEASPMGLLDLVDWLRGAAEVVPERTRLVVLLNRAADGRAEQQRLRREADRLLSPRAELVEIVGHDPHVERAAWDASVATRGPLRALASKVVSMSLSSAEQGEQSAAGAR